MKTKYWLLFSVLLGVTSLLDASPLEGRLARVGVRDSSMLRYRCPISVDGQNVTLDVSVDLSNAFMVADLGAGVRVKGFASETSEANTGTTSFFLQGSSTPYFQRLTLSIRENGKWARFSQSFGANEIECRL